MNGIELIAAERKRQIEAEGWTPEHDDTHDAGELALTAACYALAADARKYPIVGDLVSDLWPFGSCDYKPTPDDRIRELVKAGALIAAEIDRLQRLNSCAGARVGYMGDINGLGCDPDVP